MAYRAGETSAVACGASSTCSSGFRACKMGVVATVVTMAINTSMANKTGVIAPRSSATLRTISSIKPRVFIRMPSAADWRHEIPLMRAAILLPPNFPNDATRMIRPQASHCSLPLTRPIWVRRPV